MLQDMKSGALQYFLWYNGLRMDRVAPFLFCATNMHHVQLATTCNLFLCVAQVHCSEMIFAVDDVTLTFIDGHVAV